MSMQSTHNVEWSFDVEAPFAVELSLLWLRFQLVNIDHSPSLALLVVLTTNDDVSVLVVVSTLNFDNLILNVDEVLS
jgi:hypothetical protein